MPNGSLYWRKSFGSLGWFRTCCCYFVCIIAVVRGVAALAVAAAIVPFALLKHHRFAEAFSSAAATAGTAAARASTAGASLFRSGA